MVLLTYFCGPVRHDFYIFLSRCMRVDYVFGFDTPSPFRMQHGFAVCWPVVEVREGEHWCAPTFACRSVQRMLVHLQQFFSKGGRRAEIEVLE
jgi:hypothetical protein